MYICVCLSVSTCTPTSSRSYEQMFLCPRLMCKGENKKSLFFHSSVGPWKVWGPSDPFSEGVLIHALVFSSLLFLLRRGIHLRNWNVDSPDPHLQPKNVQANPYSYPCRTSDLFIFMLISETSGLWAPHLIQVVFCQRALTAFVLAWWLKCSEMKWFVQDPHRSGAAVTKFLLFEPKWSETELYASFN